MKKVLIPGFMLIFFGVYFLLCALPGVIMPSGSLLIFLGVCMLALRLITRKYGWSIAGLPVLLLGGALLAIDVLNLSGFRMEAVILGLSLAFFLIHIFEFRRIGNWPMIPALMLLVMGGGVYLVRRPYFFWRVKEYLGVMVACLLIVVGLCILLSGLIRAGRKRKNEKRARQVWAQSERVTPQPETVESFVQQQPKESPACDLTENPAADTPETVPPRAQGVQPEKMDAAQ